MTFAAYLKGAVWEFLLSSIAAVALMCTLLHGFYVDPGLQYSPIPALSVVIPIALLYALAFNKRTLRIGAVVYALAVICVLGACAAATPDILADNESNLLLFAICAFVTSLAVFALGRTRTSAAFLFIIGTFIIVFIQFFYERYELVYALLFIFSSLALVVYKNYQRSVETARSVKKVAFAPGFAVAALAVLVSVGLGSIVWFAIIAPLNPPAADIKLITEYHALETKQVRGVADMFLVPNLDMTSSHTNDDERTTDDLQIVEGGREVPANGKMESDSQGQSGGSSMGIDLSSLNEAFDFQNYDQGDWIRFIVVVVAIVLIIAGYFLGRRAWRARRLAAIRQLAPEQQAEKLYLFLVTRFGRIGLGMAPGQTVHEYALATASGMERFDTESGVAFSDLSDVYAQVAYGKDEHITQESADKFTAYYRSFWKACRSYLGTFKYFLKSFRL